MTTPAIALVPVLVAERVRSLPDLVAVIPSEARVVELLSSTSILMKRATPPTCDADTPHSTRAMMSFVPLAKQQGRHALRMVDSAPTVVGAVALVVIPAISTDSAPPLPLMVMPEKLLGRPPFAINAGMGAKLPAAASSFVRYGASAMFAWLKALNALCLAGRLGKLSLMRAARARWTRVISPSLERCACWA